MRAALMGHGTRDQRLSNFKAGYNAGAGACIDALRGVEFGTLSIANSAIASPGRT